MMQRPKPIAVVGISCRFPHAASPFEYWSMLREGRDAIERSAATRWGPGEVRDGDEGAEFGAFIDGVDQFDPAFFGISPREAAAMDPQQRLMLELAWESIEDAGLRADGLGDSRFGVFVGATASDYAHLTFAQGDDELDAFALTGLNRGMIANRISHAFDLHGPSLSVDVGQASGLAAVHLACESLWRGESEIALAGGVHLNLLRESALAAARFGGLSPDGRCFTFDARANGFVRGEGGGAILLKPLDVAQQNGDRIYCVINGSAVNSDGRSEAVAVPTVQAQTEVIRQAVTLSGISEDDIQYVELHGTGTRRGDPVEASALGAALASARSPERRLLVGSAKTNIGHLEGAAGIAGFIKSALCIFERELVPSLNFERANPEIDLDALGLEVNTELRAWPNDGRPLAAGVSSFGVGGTNVHVVVQEAPAPVAPARGSPAESRGLPWLFSARTAPALREQAASLAVELSADSRQLADDDIAYTLATRKTVFDRRAAVLAVDGGRPLAGLDALTQNRISHDVVEGDAARGRKVAFVFPGDGAGWPGMAKDLYETSEVFAGMMDECEAAFEPLTDWSLSDVLKRGDEGELSRDEILQPCLFAVMVSLAAVWRHHGVEPEAVVGHSQGEVAAAYVAGALSLEDAARVVIGRINAIVENLEGGGLASVALPASELEPWLAKYGERLSIAARNAPSATVVAGETDLLVALVEDLRSSEVPAVVLGITYASHSAHVEAAEKSILANLADVAPRPSSIPMVSSSTADLIEGEQLDAAYWYRAERQPVLFAQATERLAELGVDTIIEVAPHPVLSSAIEATLEAAAQEQSPVVLETLRRDHGSWHRFARSLAEAWVCGVAVDWDVAFEHTQAKFLTTPTYPFQRSSYWTGDGYQSQRADLLSPLVEPRWTSHAISRVPVKTVFAAVISDAELPGIDGPRYAAVAAFLNQCDELAGAGDVIVDLREMSQSQSGAEPGRERVKAMLDAWFSDPRSERFRLVALTLNSVPIDQPVQRDAAASWGELRAAQAARPGDLLSIDCGDEGELTSAMLGAALEVAGESAVAIRGNEVFVRKLETVDQANFAGQGEKSGEPLSVLIAGTADEQVRAVVRGIAALETVKNIVLAHPEPLEATDGDSLLAAFSDLDCTVELVAFKGKGARDMRKAARRVAKQSSRTAAVYVDLESDDFDLCDLVIDAARDSSLERLVLVTDAGFELGDSVDSNAVARASVLDAVAAEARFAEQTVQRIAVDLDAAGADPASFERCLGTAFDHALASICRTTVSVDPVRLRRVAEDADGSSRSEFANELAALAPAHRESTVRLLVAQHVAAVLGFESDDSIDEGITLKELGLDSIGAVELRRRLNRATGMRLTATLAYNYPTVEEISGLILSLVDQSEVETAPGQVTSAQSDEPIAIVGLACRYPGGVASPDDLWRILSDEEDCISTFPSDRGWAIDELRSASGDGAPLSLTREGGFVADADKFDAAFFGISPREASAMDPQQRLLLESAWEALENAGIDPSTLRGSDTGVFAGISSQDYIPGLQIASEFSGYALTGGSTSIVSGRVAYTLGLQGPAVTIDTACSSSLVAMHLAAQSLRSGDCDLAIAGGATVLSSPGMFVEFTRQGGLAADGRSKSFSDEADGVGWAEGIGLVVLEPLSKARANGHEVLALLRGSAVNQDGASNGLTAPSGKAQERVILKALASAGLKPTDIDVVEAHGTGTTLGDPIELEALSATYGRSRGASPVRLGSLKSNIGHAQAAAGVGGVIKMLLSLRHERLPRSLHSDAPTSKFEWNESGLSLLEEATDWPSGDSPRRAGISSFGISGTNAHVILEEPPALEPAEPLHADVGRDGPTALLISASTESALAGQAKRLLSHIEADPDASLTAIGYSLATSRAQLKHRAYAVGVDRDALTERLREFASAGAAPGVITGSGVSAEKLAFMFTGQGAQRAGAGAALYREFPAFREALDGVCELLDPMLGRPLQEVIFSKSRTKAARDLSRTQFTQPALFAIEVSLLELLRAFGMKPDFVIGHSVGEIVAAYAADVMSLEDACKLVVSRGRLMGELPSAGAMLAISASEPEVLESIERLTLPLDVAAQNGPLATVVSGGESAVEELASYWRENGRKASRLKVSHAFHSELMDPMLDAFAAVVDSLELGPPTIPIASNVSGRIIEGASIATTEYWVAQARGAVRFLDGIHAVAEAGATRFIELGPGPVLSTLASSSDAIENDASDAVQSVLTKGRDESETLLEVLSAAAANGTTIDWPKVFAGRGARRVPLPTYAFERERFWITPSAGSGSLATLGQAATGHPLLSAAVELPEGAWIFTGRLSLDSQAWFADHVVFGKSVLPASAFLDLALAAASRIDAGSIAELTLEEPLVIPSEGSLQLQVSLGAENEVGERELEIRSRTREDEADGLAWTRHAAGTTGLASAVPALWDVESWPPPGSEEVDSEALYAHAADLGLDYGPAFARVTRAWQQGDMWFAELSLRQQEELTAGGFAIHPALLDSAFHALFSDASLSRPALPFAITGASIFQTGTSRLRVQLRLEDGNIQSLVAADAGGSPVLSIGRLATREPEAESFGRTAGSSLFAVEWSELDVDQAASEPTNVLRFQSTDELLVAIAQPSEELMAAELVVVEITEDDSSSPHPADTARSAARDALILLQNWLGAEQLGPQRLCLATRMAIAARPADKPALEQSAIWGLARAAQSEHPGRVLLLDSDAPVSPAEFELVASQKDEDQFVLRAGKLSSPRLARATERDSVEAPEFDPSGTVLITGATGGLGGSIARLLVAAGA
ncbi:MAG: type I polyketide synthase, partial [Solirubrobacterales bacterium]